MGLALVQLYLGLTFLDVQSREKQRIYDLKSDLYQRLSKTHLLHLKGQSHEKEVG
jgi:hypothetical protein